MTALLEPHPLDRLQLHLDHVDRLTLTPGRTYGNAQPHGFTQILYVQSGHLEIQDRTDAHVVRRNEVAIIPAGVPAAGHCPSGRRAAEILVLWCRVAIDGIDPFAGSRVMVREQHEPAQLDAVWTQMVDYVRDNACHNDPNFRLALNGMARWWLAELCRFTAVDLQTGFHVRHRAVQDALRYMRTAFHRPVTLSEVAKHVHLSPGHLRTLFRKELGTPYSVVLRNMRLAHAKAMLTGSDMTIGEIAGRTGFSDVHHLSRTFTQVHGIAPSLFRSLALKQSRVLFEDHFRDPSHTSEWWSSRQGAGFQNYRSRPFHDGLSRLRDDNLFVTAPSDNEWLALIINAHRLPGATLKNYAIEARMTLKSVVEPAHDKVGVVLKTGFDERVLFMFRHKGFASFARSEPDVKEVPLAVPHDFTPQLGRMVDVRIEVLNADVGSQVYFWANGEFIGGRRFSTLRDATEVGLYVHFADAEFDYFRIKLLL